MSAEIIDLGARRAVIKQAYLQGLVDELVSAAVGRPVHVDPDDPNARVIREILGRAEDRMDEEPRHA